MEKAGSTFAGKCAVSGTLSQVIAARVIVPGWSVSIDPKEVPEGTEGFNTSGLYILGFFAQPLEKVYSRIEGGYTLTPDIAV